MRDYRPDEVAHQPGRRRDANRRDRKPYQQHVMLEWESMKVPGA